MQVEEALHRITAAIHQHDLAAMGSGANRLER